MQPRLRAGSDAHQLQWEGERLALVPPRWAADFAGRFAEKKRASLYAGNTWLREETEAFKPYRIPLNASDEDIRSSARRAAAECFDISRQSVCWSLPGLLDAMGRYCARWSVVPPVVDGEEITEAGALARLTDEQWWRRKLRNIHARGLEGEAIRLGYVHRYKGKYCSDETLKRRQGQKARNAETLNTVVVENDLADRFTLAELAARSVANPAIRRGELMTRIAGFEAVADQLGHVGEFVTATTPSRFHSRMWATGEENPKYDGWRIIATRKHASPRDAQSWLTTMWARVRAALARVGVRVYGFRICEPHHDGTPHWHMLMFMPAAMRNLFRKIMSRYWFSDEGDEDGAAESRIRFKRIDKAEGSAAGYVAKYVAKNIDGAHVENDLLGNPAVVLAQRVEAWATTWGIRQFQQIGGPPVTVWRELRRVDETQADKSAAIKAAWSAAQKTETHPANWGEFVAAMGGPIAARSEMPLFLAKTRPGERLNGGELAPAPLGRYGEIAKPGIYGVSDGAQVAVSTRYIWRIVKGGNDAASSGCRRAVDSDQASEFQPVLGRPGGCGSAVLPAGRPVAIGGSVTGEKGQISAPWSPVNNCTPPWVRDARSGPKPVIPTLDIWLKGDDLKRWEREREIENERKRNKRAIGGSDGATRPPAGGTASHRRANLAATGHDPGGDQDNERNPSGPDGRSLGASSRYPGDRP